MFDPLTIIETVGILGIFLIIFAESGLFFGFFLPGDTLLFVAGILATQKVLDIRILIIVCIVGAILGDSVGYWTGSRYGRKLFTKDTNFFFKKRRLIDAENFYKKYGRFTIILARFLPIIRTFAPIVAGIAKMRYQIFLSYNVVGAVLWVILIVFLGYFLGKFIPNPDKYILPIIFVIIIISFIPIIYKFIRSKYLKKNK